jgi:hypothetical protein
MNFKLKVTTLNNHGYIINLHIYLRFKDTSRDEEDNYHDENHHDDEDIEPEVEPASEGDSSLSDIEDEPENGNEGMPTDYEGHGQLEADSADDE